MNIILDIGAEDEWFDDGWSRSLDWRDLGLAERLSEPDAPPGAVDTPADLAVLLLAASPSGAEAFARARHERECERGDEERTEFWWAVMDETRRLSPG